MQDRSLAGDEDNWIFLGREAAHGLQKTDIQSGSAGPLVYLIENSRFLKKYRQTNLYKNTF